ncbi:MAG: hypothetical protein JW787_07820 [Sedimentisphaerales bacterium]|nr:hypothetical protein [Sedimentisphaerales bacterium]
MKSIMRFMIIASAVLLICNTVYAKKGNSGKGGGNQKSEVQAPKQSKEKPDAGKNQEVKAAKTKKETEKAAAVKKESGQKKIFGFAYGKNHQQQLKALDKKTAKAESNKNKKIASLEKRLSAAKTANDTQKIAQLEKQIADTNQKFADDNKKIEDKRTKIKTEIIKNESLDSN